MWKIAPDKYQPPSRVAPKRVKPFGVLRGAERSKADCERSPIWSIVLVS
jgi:hypothetical protein